MLTPDAAASDDGNEARRYFFIFLFNFFLFHTSIRDTNGKVLTPDAAASDDGNKVRHFFFVFLSHTRLIPHPYP